MTTTIEVFADVLCPFTHAGLRRLVQRRDELGGTFRLWVRAWPLELVNGEPMDPEMLAEEIDQLREVVAPDLFVGFSRDAVPSSSIPALSLVDAAYRQSSALGERASLLVRDALFEKGRDIADRAVLAELAAELELPEPGIDRRRIEDDWREGQRRGVVGSPHFIVGEAGYFCPSMTVRKVDGQLDISFDAAAFDALVDQCMAR